MLDNPSGLIDFVLSDMSNGCPMVPETSHQETRQDKIYKIVYFCHFVTFMDVCEHFTPRLSRLTLFRTALLYFIFHAKNDRLYLK